MLLELAVYLLYKDESMCVCVYVCVSGGLPPGPHNLSPQNLAWAPHFTLARHRARGDLKCWPPGVPPTVTPSEIPWRVNNWAGTSKQKLFLGVGLHGKFFLGGSPLTRARRVHPTKRGCMLWELGKGQQTKVAPWGRFTWENFICGGLTSTLGPHGSPHQMGGICFENWAMASKQKLLLGVGLPGKILFVGGWPQLWARTVHPTKWGYKLWELGGD